MRASWPTIILCLTCLLVGCSDTTGVPDSSSPSGRRQEFGQPPAGSEVEYADPTRPATKWALLVGINEYRYPSRVSSLAGCVNDVELMKSVLIGKYEYPESQVLVLTNEAATHQGILHAFRDHLIRNAQRDDVVIFHYSGHGSQMRDTSGDELDGWDETLVPHDSRDPEGKVFDISDDELNTLFLELQQRTRNITFILDSCNSGTALRAAGNVRRIAPDERTPPAEPGDSGTRGVSEGSNDWRPDNLNYTLISGCLAGESSFEHWADNREHGALTYFLASQLRQASPQSTYRDVMDAVSGKVNARYPAQHPQLEGAGSDKVIFGDTTVLARPFVLCSPRSQGTVELQAGQAYGATIGSVFEIFAPGTKDFGNTDNPLGRCQVTQVGNFSSVAKLSTPVTIPNFSRAVEWDHSYPEFRLRVHLQGLGNSPALRGVREELEQYHHLEFQLQPRDYHVLLRQAGAEIVMEGGDQTEIAPRTPIDDADAVGLVVRRTLDWAKWFNILSIANPSPGLDVRLSVSEAEGDGGRGTPLRRIGAPTLVLQDGQAFECKVENRSDKGVYLSILDLSTDGSVSMVYPQSGTADLLVPNGVWQRRLNTFVPDGRSSVRDVLKVFATTSPVDFRFLQRDPVRGGVAPEELSRSLGTPLRQLISSVALGTTRNVSSPVPLGDWSTSEQVIEVRRE